MGMRMSRPLRVGIIVSCVCLIAFAQNRPAANQPLTTIHSRTELVTVPVVVTRSGRHVGGLVKDDFSVFEDGKQKSIAVFEEVKVQPGLIRQVHPAEGTYTNELAGTGGPAGLTVILFDTLNTDYLYQANGRNELIKFLSSFITAGQPTMLLQLKHNGLSVVHNFSTSPEVLIAALKRVKGTLEGEHATGTTTDLSRNDNSGHPLDVTNDARTRFESAAQRDARGLNPIGDAIDVTKEANAIQGFVNETPLERLQQIEFCDHARTTLDGFQQVVRSMGAIPGRKTMIWATGGRDLGFWINEPTGDCPELADEVHRTWNLLSSANIVVYPVNLEQPVNPIYASPDGKTADLHPIYKEMLFQGFAERTGGTVCSFRNDLDTCFKKAVADSSEYYMLGYYATPRERPGWRHLKVTSRASGVRLRARSEYYSLGTKDDPDTRRKAEIALAILSPVEYTGLPFSVKWTHVKKADEKHTYGFEILVNGRALTIDREDRNHLKMSVAVVAQDERGTIIGDLSQELDARLRPDSLQKIISAGLRYTSGLQAPAGEYTVRFIIRDAFNGRMGTVTAPLPPPDSLPSWPESVASEADTGAVHAPHALPHRLHLLVEMQNTIDAGKARIGDEVRMKVLRSESENNLVVIPKGARLLGRVTEAVARDEDGQSRLRVILEQAEWKSTSVPLHAFIVAQGQVRYRTDCGMRSLEGHPCAPRSSPEKWATPVLSTDVELRTIGNPPTGSLLLSREHPVVLRQGMVLILRNADQPAAQ